MVGSRYPLLVMVEPEQEAFMRRHVTVNSHPSSAVLPWRRFPEKVARNDPWRYRSAHVMDKMTRAVDGAGGRGLRTPLVEAVEEDLEGEDGDKECRNDKPHVRDNRNASHQR